MYSGNAFKCKLRNSSSSPGVEPIIGRKKKKLIIDAPSRKSYGKLDCANLSVNAAAHVQYYMHYAPQQAITDPWLGFNVVNYYVSLT